MQLGSSFSWRSYHLFRSCHVILWTTLVTFTWFTAISKGFKVTFSTPYFELHKLLRLRCKVNPDVTITQVTYYKGEEKDQYVYVWTKDDPTATEPLGHFQNRNISHEVNEAVGSYDLLLLNPSVNDEGKFWCDMYGEPFYIKGLDSGYVRLVGSSKDGPLVKTHHGDIAENSCDKPKVLQVKTKITTLICSTPASRPWTNITWYVDSMEQAAKPNRVALQDGFSSLTSTVEVNMSNRRNVAVKCKSILPYFLSTEPVRIRSVCLSLERSYRDHHVLNEKDTLAGLSALAVLPVCGLLLLLFYFSHTGQLRLKLYENCSPCLTRKAENGNDRASHQTAESVSFV